MTLEFPKPSALVQTNVNQLGASFCLSITYCLSSQAIKLLEALSQAVSVSYFEQNACGPYLLFKALFHPRRSITRNCKLHLNETVLN